MEEQKIFAGDVCFFGKYQHIAIATKRDIETDWAAQDYEFRLLNDYERAVFSRKFQEAKNKGEDPNKVIVSISELSFKSLYDKNYQLTETGVEEKDCTAPVIQQMISLLHNRGYKALEINMMINSITLKYCAHLSEQE